MSILSPNSPIRTVLMLLVLLVVSGCGDRSTQRPAQPSSEALLADHTAAQFGPEGPGGVVLVARGERILLREAYGWADVEGRQPMRIDQSLPIGSLTKSFTAAAILHLVEQGQLTLDTDVGRLLPGAPLDGNTVTIEQLLTHTSGMPNLVDGPDFMRWAQRKRGTDELLAHTRSMAFHFSPGEGFAYSDSGYIVLGAVLEQRTKMGWAEAIRTLVGEPLGLRSLQSAERWVAERESGDRASDEPAVGYNLRDGELTPADYLDWSVPHASGALVASADDLLRWIRAWHDRTLFEPALHRRAWAPRALPDGRVSGYGFGWKRCDFQGRTAIQHGGWVPGYSASVLHLPGENLTAIALLNSEGGPEASYLTRRMLRLLLTGHAEPAPYPMTARERQGLLGSYRTQRGEIWRVTERSGEAALDLASSRIALTPLSATELCAADSDQTWCFEFHLGEDGVAEIVDSTLTCEPQARAHRVPD
jgi:CubicO group peptidase (beta-lactamase class C family)